MVERPARRLGAAVTGAGARGYLGMRMLGGGSYASMMRSASSQANTTSRARTMMLWNGLRHVCPEPDIGRHLPRRSRGARS